MNLIATTAKKTNSKIKTVNSNSNRIHKINVEKHFSKVENWLVDKISGAKNALERRAWALLCYYLRIYSENPAIEVSPEWAAQHFKVSRRTAYSWFKFLKKEGHVRTFKMRSNKGFIIGTEYFIYQHRFQWRTTTCKNLHKVDFIDKNINIFEDGICIFTPVKDSQDDAICINLHEAEITSNNESSYNKNTPAHAHEIRLKTILKTTTTTPPKSPPEPPPSPPPEEPLKSSVVVSLHEKIKPDHRVKVALSTLEKALSLYTEKQVETLIGHINDPKKEIKNPSGYIHKACNEKWEIEEFDSSKITVEPTAQEIFDRNIKSNMEDIYKNHAEVYKSLSREDKKIVFDAIISNTKHDFLKKHFIKLGPDKCADDKAAMAPIKNNIKISNLCYKLAGLNENK